MWLTDNSPSRTLAFVGGFLVASVSRDPSGKFRIQFVDASGARQTLRLPTGDRKAAESIARHVDALLGAKLASQPIPRETAAWLGSIGDVLRDRLVRVGLIEAGPGIPRLGDYLKDWVETRRSSYKPASLLAWGQVVARLLEHFGSDCPLSEITHARAEGFRQAMIAAGLRPTTIHKRLQHARLIFAHAVRLGLLASNPFEHVRHRAGDVSERRAYVPAADVLRVIDCAPNVWWRLLIALSRFAGLRIPSEAFSLRWQDVDWERSRLIVPSPKTQHLPGRAYRVVPLFPAIRHYLEEAWELAPDGAEYVLPDEYRQRAMGPCGWRNANLRTTLAKIIRRAGLKPWPRLWHSLRASCESDLVASFPLAVVTKWLGNTPSIALRHYIDVTDGDFERALQWVPEGLEKATQNPTQQVNAECRKMQKSITLPCESRQCLPRLSSSNCIFNAPQMEAAGIEPASRDISASASTCVVSLLYLVANVSD